jgi:hypothetical protein
VYGVCRYWALGGVPSTRVDARIAQSV